MGRALRNGEPLVTSLSFKGRLAGPTTTSPGGFSHPQRPWRRLAAVDDGTDRSFFYREKMVQVLWLLWPSIAACHSSKAAEHRISCFSLFTAKAAARPSVVLTDDYRVYELFSALLSHLSSCFRPWCNAISAYRDGGLVYWAFTVKFPSLVDWGDGLDYYNRD